MFVATTSGECLSTKPDSALWKPVSIQVAGFGGFILATGPGPRGVHALQAISQYGTVSMWLGRPGPDACIRCLVCRGMYGLKAGFIGRIGRRDDAG
jgi:hypothetical protein